MDQLGNISYGTEKYHKSHYLSLKQHNVINNLTNGAFQFFYTGVSQINCSVKLLFTNVMNIPTWPIGIGIHTKTAQRSYILCRGYILKTVCKPKIAHSQNYPWKSLKLPTSICFCIYPVICTNIICIIKSTYTSKM
jgi:hypothetical protein